MRREYQIAGMTCDGCARTVDESLSAVPGVEEVSVDLVSGEAVLQLDPQVEKEQLQSALGSKYQILEKSQYEENSGEEVFEAKSKLAQLRPLLLVLSYLFAAAFLLNFKSWDTKEAMLDFMGLFYIVFSFFKFLDLKGFPDSFRMYDPLARRVPIYGWIYPFLELGLGLLFLTRSFITLALITTVIILGITTVGVTRTLLDKKRIRCACLGTALKLPMTEATFIENAIMLVMAGTMLFMDLA